MPIYNAKAGGGSSSSGYSLVALSSNKSSVSLTTNTTTADFTITYTGDGTLTATSANTSIATVALVNGKTYRITAANNVNGSTVITVKASVGATTIPVNTVTIDVDVNTWNVSNTLHNNSWDVISAISAAGTASNYWSVGDTKAITLSGTVCSLSLSSTLYVYILGFNHNASKEGSGISFGTFKTALSGGRDVALIDSLYGSTSSSNGYFNINPTYWSSGGWKNCYMRYNVLGSTDTSNENATSTTATSPISGSLMAALPNDLRSVMKPITKYSDNTGDGSDTSSYVTATIDYLPLLAEYEVFGTKDYANSAEKNNQAQYQYYINGNSKVKYRHSSTGSTCMWWLRSVHATNNGVFCYVGVNGDPDAVLAYYCFGVAPVFLV